MSSLDKLLDKWYNLKRQISNLNKEEEKIKSSVKKAMSTKGLNTLSSERYRVTLKQSSRETLSKKNCPSDVWAQYSKKSTFPLVKLESLQGGDELKSDDENVEI